MFFLRSFLRPLFPALAALGLFAASARGQEPVLAPGHPHYYPGVPANFISAAPRAGTFYYNDFNRYGYFHFPEGSRVYVALAGNMDGTEGSKNFSGEAIIGQDRGAIWINGDPLAGGSNFIKRSTTSFFQVNPGNAADPFAEFSAPGGSTGTVTMQVMNNSLLSGGLVEFHVSTSGYTGVRLSLDLGVLVGASANYRVEASADGGATWTYSDQSTLINLTAQQWFNGVPAETNPQAVFDFSAHPEFDDNPLFVCRIYAIPSPETGLWTSETGATSEFPYPANLALDRINFTGVALPPTPTLLQQWRQTHFGGPDAMGSAADAADPDGDGLPNLLEYALGGLPLVSDGGARAPATAVAADHLQLSFDRIADPGLLYQVEASPDLVAVDGWSEVWRSTGAQNIAEQVTVADTISLTSQPRRFLRLRVSGY